MEDYDKIYDTVKKELQKIESELEDKNAEKDKIKDNLINMNILLEEQKSEFGHLCQERDKMFKRPKINRIIEGVMGILIIALILGIIGILTTHVISPFIKEIATLLGRLAVSSVYFASVFVIIIFSGSMLWLANDRLDNKWIRKVQNTKDYEILGNRIEKRRVRIENLEKQISFLREAIDTIGCEIDSLGTKFSELKSFKSYVENLMNPQSEVEVKNKNVRRKKKDEENN